MAAVASASPKRAMTTVKRSGKTSASKPKAAQVHTPVLSGRLALIVEKSAMVLISAGALAQALGHTDLAALLLGVGGACGVSGGK